MRAVGLEEFGGPDVLRVHDVPDPRPPVRDEILVRVQASSVNGTDLGLRRGDLRAAAWRRSLLVLGFDIAGEVTACGPEVTAFRPGDRVMALLGHRGGGQAEQVLLRQRRAARVPTSCTPEQAAALPLAGLTALQALYGFGLQTRAPCRVLVLGASGGVGSYAVQLAAHAGAHVTGVASGAKLEFVQGLGAAEVVDHKTQDVHGLGERWDVVLDVPGTYGFRRLRDVVSPGGVLVSTRGLDKDSPRALVPARLRRGPEFAAVRTRARSQDLAHLAALVDSGRLRVPLDRVFPMEDAAAAHEHAAGPGTGKTVLRIGRSPTA